MDVTASFALIVVIIALFLGCIAWFMPFAVIPPRGVVLTPVEIMEQRNELRKTGLQFIGGLSFIVTFLVSIVHFNKEYSQKTRIEAVKEFSDAAAKIDKTKPQWSDVGVFETLAQVARDDPSLGPASHGLMAAYLKAHLNGCGPHETRSAKAATVADHKDRTLGYRMESELQKILQIFAGNNVPDRWGGLTDLAGVCLSRATLQGMPGLRQLWLRDARLLGADFRYADLTETWLVNVEGGVDQIEEWWRKRRITVADLAKADGYKHLGDMFYQDGIYHWVNFSDANLQRVHGEQARLAGAQFVAAKMAASVWKGSDLRLANFERAELFKADLSGIEKLSGSNFKAAKLQGAIMRSSNFAHADLTGAKFENTDVSGADLSSAIGLDASQVRGMCIGPDYSGAPHKLPVALTKPDLDRCKKK
jgi:uncharacterized protein YjbI with pentapeptide repeats